MPYCKTCGTDFSRYEKECPVCGMNSLITTETGVVVGGSKIAKEQQKLVATLIQDGFGPSQAAAVAESLLERVARSGKDDPALEIAKRLLGKG